MERKYYSMLVGGTLTMMVVSALLMSDSIIAGAVIGPDAVAGVTLVTPLYSISAFFSSVFSLGVPIIYSSQIGKFNRKEADRAFGFGMFTSIMIGAGLFALSWLFGDMWLRSCHPTPKVLEQAQGYLFWMRFTILLLPMQILLAEMVYIDGDEKTSTAASLVQGIGNIAGSLILSQIMGIRGIALASFAFVFISLAILFLHFLKKTNTLRINFCFSFRMVLQTARYSIIDAATYLFLGILTAVMSRFVSERFGPGYLVLVSMAALCREFQLVFDGIGEAITPIVSIYLSEDCVPGTKSIYSLARKTAVTEGIVLMLALMLAAPLVPEILGIDNSVVYPYTVNGTRIIAAGSVFVSLLYLSTSYYLLIDRIRLGVIISAARDLLLAAPLGILLGYAFGINGMLAGIAAAPAIAWLGTMLVLRKKYRDDAPLLLGARERKKRALLYDLQVEPEAITRTRDGIGADLRTYGYDTGSVNRTMLLFEEVMMLLHEKNRGRKILGECGLLLGEDSIRMIVRDTGEKFDVTDADLNVSSLRSYVVSNVAQALTVQKRYMTAMSFNRNAFEIRGSRKTE